MQRLGFLPKVWEAPTPEVLAAPIFDSLAWKVQDLSVEELFTEQPHLRTVTDFIARSIASVSLHVYRREADGGRVRVREGQLSKLMRRASAGTLMYDLLHGSIMDLCLYDEVFWAVSTESGGGDPEILRIPPTWIVKKNFSSPWTLESLVLNDDRTGMPFEIPAERVVWIHGYAPGSMKRGTSPVHALKDLLREQLESAAYRGQLWKNGPRLGGVIERPQNAGWDNRARQRFKAAWQSQYSGRGSGAGGTPVLEDGMQFKPFHLKAQDEQVVDMTKLSLQTVASVYHVNPTMVGLLDNANYSNVREFRRSLYGDSLGPLIKRIEDALNLIVLPMLPLDESEQDDYVEFNLDEKLRASFEEKAAVTSTAVGGPWMTVNEARAMNNMPSIDGGDDLIRPLNVGVAGEPDSVEEPAEPEDSPPDGEEVGT